MSLVHQETWVRHGTNGIGISDHQNRYSNGVRVANWVENECGDVLKVWPHTLDWSVCWQVVASKILLCSAFAHRPPLSRAGNSLGPRALHGHFNSAGRLYPA